MKPQPENTLATSRPSGRIWALVPCAGTGLRSGAQGPKQYQTVAGKPMVMHTLAAFAAVHRLQGVVVVVSEGDTFFQIPNTTLEASILVASCGGSTRASSVLNGLSVLLEHGAADTDWVLVHDAARCLITAEQIDRLIDACLPDEVGGLLALKLPDTLKSETDGRAQTTVERSDKWLAQTPQMFRIADLTRALKSAGDAVTDESSAMEAMGQHPLLVEGSAQNFKVTYAQDFALAQAVLLARTASMEKTMNFRIGEGWDIHALIEGRKLVLGGVDIPHSKGLLGHSDADALLHAITDALLGAAALGDIGTHFPDTDVRFKGADSGVLLVQAVALVKARGYAIGNVDSTIIAQAPRMASHIGPIRERIAALLGIPVDRVNVKAKTAEKMGPVGEGLAIEARAVVLLF